MPTVPFVDPTTIQNPQNPLMGTKGVSPENVLMAADIMHDQSRLVAPSGDSSGMKLPHKAKGPSQRMRRR